MPTTRNNECKCEELMLKMMDMFQDFMKAINDRENKRMELEKERLKLEQRRFEAEQEERKRMETQEKREEMEKKKREELKKKVEEENRKMEEQKKQKELELRQMQSEEAEIEKRKNNLFVCGMQIEDKQSAKTKIQELLKTMECSVDDNEIKVVPVSTDKCIIQFESKVIRDRAYAKRKNAASNGRKVFLNFDQTPKQREESKRLRDERRAKIAENPGKTYIIKKGKVVEVLSEKDKN